MKSILKFCLLILLLPLSAQAENMLLRFGGSYNIGMLPLLAKEKGFFADEGLDVSYEFIQSGKLTMDALLAGKLDVGVIVDSNVSFVNFQKNPLRVIAAIHNPLQDGVVFRRDRGIKTPEDLRGKTIGYLPATTSHIFLSRFLKKHGIKWDEVKTIVLQPPATAAAIRGGSVDAISMWNPWRANALAALENNGGEFANDAGTYPSRTLLAAPYNLIVKQRPAFQAFLKGLLRAEHYANKHPEEVQQLFARLSNIDPKLAAATFGDGKFKVDLNRDSLNLVTEIGSWIIESQRDFQNKKLPNYSHAFRPGLLWAIDPKRVDLKRAASRRINVCRPNNMVSALAYIAEKQGFFLAHNVVPTFLLTTNAKICQDSMLAEKSDVMNGGEAPFAFLSATEHPLVLLAQLETNPETGVFARKDRGITAFADLKGKRVGYLPGTVSWIYLEKLLQKLGLKKSDLQLMPLQPPALTQALIGGAADAIVTWEPWGTLALDQLGTNGIQLSDPSLYQYQALFLTRRDYLAAHRGMVADYLRALIDAEKFIKTHKTESVSILAEALKIDSRILLKYWEGYNFHVHLGQDTLDLLADDFRLIQAEDRNFTNVPTPNFRNFTDPSVLFSIAPGRVEQGLSN